MKYSKTFLFACVLFVGLLLIELIRLSTTAPQESCEQRKASEEPREVTELAEVSHEQRKASEKPRVVTKLTEVSREQKRFPDALIIGVAKAGTGALKDFLYLHPSVRTAGQEVHYFDREENFEQGINFYLSNLPAVRDTEVLIEKTPAYFVTPGVPQAIRAIQPNVKLLLVVRDPIDRLVSDYLQIAEKRKASGAAEQSLRDALYYRSRGNGTSPAIRRESVYVRSSMYCIHMVEWLKYFPRNQILVIGGEQFAESPYDSLKVAEKFLNLEPFFKPEQFVYDKAKGFYCIQKRSVGRGEGLICLGDTKGRPHPTVDERIIQDLKALFSNCTHKFEEQTGMKFKWSHEH